MLKNVNRRTQQTQSRQPPDNDKMADKRSKQTKPRTERTNSGIKETYHRKTSRQAIKQPEAHANAQNRQKKISPAKRHINGRKSTRAAQSAPNGKEEEKDLKRKKPAATYFPAKSSIIGVRELDFRVRNGNGYCLSTVATGILCHVVQHPSAQGPPCVQARMSAFCP